MCHFLIIKCDLQSRNSIFLIIKCDLQKQKFNHYSLVNSSSLTFVTFLINGDCKSISSPAGQKKIRGNLISKTFIFLHKNMKRLFFPLKMTKSSIELHVQYWSINKNQRLSPILMYQRYRNEGRGMGVSLLLVIHRYSQLFIRNVTRRYKGISLHH